MLVEKSTINGPKGFSPFFVRQLIDGIQPTLAYLSESLIMHGFSPHQILHETRFP
jgi:hypothetical protein